MTCQKIHPAGSLHDFSYESINVENRQKKNQNLKGVHLNFT